MSFCKRIPLNNGTSIPQIGLGTARCKSHEAEFSVELAIRNGYRHIDLAWLYQNHDGVRAALGKVIPSVIKREELFITSKMWNTTHRQELVEAALDVTLGQLGIDYLDLYLIHTPVAFIPSDTGFPLDATNPQRVALDTEASLVDTWKAMIALPKTKVKAVGVSNFSIEHLEGIIAATGVVPAVNQIEAHPLLHQDNLVAYCKEKGIHITAYAPLVSTYPEKALLTEHPIVKEVAQNGHYTTAQVLIAWGAARGYSVIPKSVREQRILSNFRQVKLSQGDYETITNLGVRNYTRLSIPYTWAVRWDINIFGEPAEKEATHKIRVR